MNFLMESRKVLLKQNDAAESVKPSRKLVKQIVISNIKNKAAEFVQPAINRRRLKICRFCLDGSCEEFRNIFDDDSLTEKIRMTILMLVKPSDEMPQFICNNCYVLISTYYKFLEICRKAHSILQEGFIDAMTITQNSKKFKAEMDDYMKQINSEKLDNHNKLKIYESKSDSPVNPEAEQQEKQKKIRRTIVLPRIFKNTECAPSTSSTSITPEEKIKKEPENSVIMEFKEEPEEINQHSITNAEKTVHNSKCGAKRNFTCSLDMESFESFSLFEIHMLSKHNLESKRENAGGPSKTLAFACNLCGYVTTSQYAFENHEVKAHLNFSQENASNLKTVAFLDVASKYSICTICNLQFLTKQGFDAHNEAIHNHVKKQKVS